MHRLTIKAFIFYLIMLSPNIVCAEDGKEFDYRQSVALVLLAENGGHIFQRPSYDDPRNAFRIAFDAIDGYLTHIAQYPSNNSLADSTLLEEYQFILVNHEEKKLFYLGNHWLSDGENIVLINDSDYFALKDVFDSANRHRNDVTQGKVVDYYINDIHQLWKHDKEEYKRAYYFPPKITQREIEQSSDEAIPMNISDPGINNNRDTSSENAKEQLKKDPDTGNLQIPAEHNTNRKSDVANETIPTIRNLQTSSGELNPSTNFDEEPSNKYLFFQLLPVTIGIFLLAVIYIQKSRRR